MPRPGPRPYECVRRAWHSDTHQPIRGSIIQQVLRVVNESHSSATKRNREWQEKLPVVVLKVEEIIYSKANSETEYLDAETLWERVNDAIDTIIRRDESTETGELLPPCVEAALNLGCVPIRTTRSERNAQQRNYLYTGGEVHDEARHRMKQQQQQQQQQPSFPAATAPSSQFTIVRQPSVSNQTLPDMSSFYIPAPSSNHQFAVNSLGSVYPPQNYHGYPHHIQAQTLWMESDVGNTNASSCSRPILLSKPECAKMGCLQNLFPLPHDVKKGSERNGLVVVPTNKNNHNHNETSDEMTCDLSLRLSLFSGK